MCIRVYVSQFRFLNSVTGEVDLEPVVSLRGKHSEKLENKIGKRKKSEKWVIKGDYSGPE